jgi:hypothetical protein
MVALAAMLLPTSALADDDAVEWYDVIYNRPTFFTNFEPPHSYANNMSYFVCTLDASTHERLYNYEVAVYDESDALRATGRSRVSDQNVCTLTILGTEGETFHFKVLFGDFVSPMIADVEETCTFVTNDIVGGFAKPFWLTMKTATSVGGISVDRAESAAPVYNLQGQRVTNPVAGHVYIQNGKKYIKK